MVKITVCDAARRGGEADNVDLSLAQVGHHQNHQYHHNHTHHHNHQHHHNVDLKLAQVCIEESRQ